MNIVKQRSQTFSKDSHAGGMGDRGPSEYTASSSRVSRGHRLHRRISSANIVVDPTQQNPVRRMVNNAIDVRAGITLR